MDAKEIKVALKEAREAIRTKDYKLALKHCKSILKADKDNYNALVFIGVAAQELEQPDQAVAAFKRAIAVSSEQLLAWQGLSAFYEKNNGLEQKKELLEIYPKLAELQSGDTEKKYDTLGKYAQLLIETEQIELCVDTLKKQLYLIKGNSEKEFAVQSAIIKALASTADLSLKFSSLLEEALQFCITTEIKADEVDKNQWVTTYIAVLLQKGDVSRAVEEARKQVATGCTQSLELICQDYVTRVIDNDGSELLDISDITSSLLANSSSSRSGRLALIASKYYIGDWQGVSEAIGSVTSVNKVNECVLLTNCHEVLHRYSGVLKFAEEGLQLSEKLTDEKKVDFQKRFQLGLIKARYHLGGDDIEADIQQLKKFLKEKDSDLDLVKLLIMLYLKLGKPDEAKQVLREYAEKYVNVGNHLGLQGIISQKEGLLDAAKEQLEEAVKLLPCSVEFLFELAMLLRKLKDYPISLVYLLTALKLDPFHPKLFLHAGHHYKLQQDFGKAKRCYLKSYSLNSLDEETGAALSDLYRETGEEDANLALLTSVTNSPTGASTKWAQIRLGLHYLKVQNPNASVKALQAALRSDPKDSCCWEALADAYLARGSYTSAFKSYSRALELNEDSIYCSYQMASVKQLLQEYSDALIEYKSLLAKAPTYVPGLKGYAEALLFRARGHFSNYFHGLAKDCCEEAIKALTKAALLRPDLSCIWKLLGDACTLPVDLPVELSSMHVPPELLGKDPEEKSCILDKKSLLALGGRCYGKAVSIQTDSALLWHDTGINYYYQAKIHTGSDAAGEFWQKSLLSLQKAVILDQKSPQHWNALGVVAAGTSSNALAQHAFIRSIQCEKNNLIAWTNLGALYLINDNIELAHQAFSTAQSIDPAYIQCWIGQALIAERVGHTDAMDLFRHTTSLSNHAESAIGYANWVTGTLLTNCDKKSAMYEYWVKNMAAIPSASDCMARYTDRNRSNTQALNMYGLLLEKQRMYSSALSAFLKSLSLAEVEGDKVNIDKVRSNYARILSTLGRYKEAIHQYSSIKEPDFSSQCYLGLAHYKLGNYEESYQAYEAASSWFAQNDEEKAHVSVAMAMIAFQMNDVDNVKTLLFQSSQMQPPSVPGLLALCALGLLQKDINLTKAALQALLPHAKTAEYASKVTFLMASTFLIQDKIQLSRNHICKAIHEDPSNAELWSLLVHHLLQHRQSGTKAAAKCASTAQQMTTLSISTNTSGNACNTYQMLSIISICYLIAGCIKSALRSAQKAVHANPVEVTNWSCLVAALVAQDAVGHSTTAQQLWFKKIVDFTCAEAKEQEANCPEQWVWLSWYKTILSISAGSSLKAKTAFNQGLSSRSKNTEVALTNDTLDTFLHCVTSHEDKTAIPVEELKQAVVRNPSNNFGWQALFREIAATGDLAAVQAVTQSWIQNTVNLQQPQMQVVPLLFLASFALSAHQNAQSGTVLSVAKDAVTGALRWNPESKAAYFVSAIVYFRLRLKRKSEECLRKVLTLADDSTGWIDDLATQYLKNLDDN